jgi:hypothetical protein
MAGRGRPRDYAEAVAQTPKQARLAVLRVGSKRTRLAARARRPVPGIVGSSVVSGHRSECSPGLCRQPRATASRESKRQRSHRSSRPRVSMVDQCGGVCPDPINTEPANRI